MTDLDAFFRSIPNSDQLLDRQLIELFGYFLQVEMGQLGFQPRQIDECFVACDLPAPTWTRTHLNKFAVKGKTTRYIKTGDGYKLTRQVFEEIKALLSGAVQTTQAGKALAGLSVKFTDPIEKEYLDEALACFKVGANRATITMVWTLTIDHIYRYILKHKMADFNAALSKQADKKIQALKINVRDDFTELKETKFIEIIRSAGIISNDVRKILDEKLGTRNSAAHPSAIKFSQRKTEEFIEDLINNVILKYSI